jgi:hypothetical protein
MADDYVHRMCNATGSCEFDAMRAGLPWGDALIDWIDSKTRAVVIDVSVYNPSIGLLTVVKLIAEVHLGVPSPLYYRKARM